MNQAWLHLVLVSSYFYSYSYFYHGDPMQYLSRLLLQQLLRQLFLSCPEHSCILVNFDLISKISEIHVLSVNRNRFALTFTLNYAAAIDRSTTQSMCIYFIEQLSASASVSVNRWIFTFKNPVLLPKHT